ncbi:MAG: rhomboid family intramembrane serine protease [Flavobacteriales bacterium]|jgi:membrane associated rhomboid family serine protease|nr:rhomboid family intramembrane serine protease [Flavobacteriales bacterium]MDP4717528.1 rhomboid family intramembrane serine protease [Flavobacteriales bacterium]MDP4730482.1 rhomboid family intramembrane serine protease [Flavobacteriales bacterium]MDP4817604.1 rhomboid family intramembrane serine protease [Flavobacteriales bacterium]MDP4951441.1 rhomboid family intramembrane serine protease [Flavobacteriales bacterium]
MILPQDKQKLLDALLWSSIFILLFIISFYGSRYLNVSLSNLGVEPRTWKGILNMPTMLFVHASTEHLWNNTLAFFILTTTIFFFYYDIAIPTFLIMWVFSPIILLVIGRDNVHVGASVLIYAEFAFLFFSGIFRRNLNTKRISMAVGFVYGYTVWYMFPIEQQVSWEGHISGFICGIMLAWYFRKQGPPEPVYRHEVEPELSDEDPFWLETIQEKEQKTTLSDANSE